MIISHKYKYVFVEVPLTGSTAISAELREHYDGHSILKKHSTYAEFYRQATDQERQYFIFCGVRNPLDQAVSFYQKTKSNHKQNYTDTSKLKENGGWVTDRDVEQYIYLADSGASFSEYFVRYSDRLYHNVYLDSVGRYDYVIRFEDLVGDFLSCLKGLSIESVRALPVVNKTQGRGMHFYDYYDDDAQSVALLKYGPFMSKWKYEFPDSWTGRKYGFWDSLHFRYIAFTAIIRHSSLLLKCPRLEFWMKSVYRMFVAGR